MKGVRYIGDVVFDVLTSEPGFLDEARPLIAEDWRTGTENFKEYAGPLAGAVFAVGGFEAYGDFDYRYLERRVMSEVLDMHQDPWLWTYDALIGALIDPIVARTALNGIAGR